MKRPRFHPKELENVMNLPPAKRYAHFVKTVVDWETVWGLYHDGWVMCGNDQGVHHIPFWPKQEIAHACAQSEWIGATAREIVITDFMNKWLPGMAKDGLKVAITPDTEGRVGISVEPLQLLKDLRDELSNLERDDES